jgi:predicted ATPase
MLIAISSSQGAGKTTCIAALKDAGYGTVERKTSRSILSDWGVSLSDVNSNPDLTIKFQEEILTRKWADDVYANTQGVSVVFTERSFVDLWTYALVALGSHNQYSDWLDEYYRKCIVAQQIYDKVYYLTAGHFKVEADGVRGANRHYSRMVDTVMYDYYKQMTRPDRTCVIDTPNFEDRMTIFTTHNPR